MYLIWWINYRTISYGIWQKYFRQYLSFLGTNFDTWSLSYTSTILLHRVVTSSCIWNWNTRPTQRQTLDEEPNYCRSPVNCRGGNRFPLSTVAKGHSFFMFSCSIYWWRYTRMLHFWLCHWLISSSFFSGSESKVRNVFLFLH